MSESSEQPAQPLEQYVVIFVAPDGRRTSRGARFVELEDAARWAEWERTARRQRSALAGGDSAGGWQRTGFAFRRGGPQWKVAR
jgi:hypothetical protein